MAVVKGTGNSTSDFQILEYVLSKYVINDIFTRHIIHHSFRHFLDIIDAIVCLLGCHAVMSPTEYYTYRSKKAKEEKHIHRYTQ